MNKLEDNLFLSEIKENDIVLSAETNIGYNQKITLEDFHCFQVCRPASGNGRFYGGLAGCFDKISYPPSCFYT